MEFTCLFNFLFKFTGIDLILVNINTLAVRDVILHPFFPFLYAEDVLICLSAKFDFDHFSI